MPGEVLLGDGHAVHEELDRAGGQAGGVDAVRARLRMGESVTLFLSPDTTARLVVPETFVSHTRRAGEVTHATLLRDPRTLTTSDFLVLVREGEDPARIPPNPDQNKCFARPKIRVRQEPPPPRSLC